MNRATRPPLQVTKACDRCRVQKRRCDLERPCQPCGNMWDVPSTYKFMMDSLEEWKAVAEDYSDPEHFKVNIILGWDKMNDYYTKLDERPAYNSSAILSPVPTQPAQ